MSIFRDILDMVKEELFSPKEPQKQEAHHTEAQATSPPLDTSASAAFDALSEISNELTQEVESLENCNSVLKQQIETVQTSLDLSQEQQQEIFSPSLQTLQDMERKLHTVQQANQRLDRTIHEKRSLLGTKKLALKKAEEREAFLLRSIQELHNIREQINQENTTLKSTLAQLEADFKHLGQEHTTLTKEYDTLIGEYHQRFETQPQNGPSSQSTGENSQRSRETPVQGNTGAPAGAPPLSGVESQGAPPNISLLFGRFLTSSGRATEAQVQQAAQLQKELDQCIGLVAVAEGFLTVDNLRQILAHQRQTGALWLETVRQLDLLHSEQITALEEQHRTYASFRLGEVMVLQGSMSAAELQAALQDLKALSKNNYAYGAGSLVSSKAE